MVIDILEFAQGMAYSYFNRLVASGVLATTTDDQPRTYTTYNIDLTITTTDDDRAYTITAALIDAVGRRTTDGGIDTYINRHRIASLVTALTAAVDREHGTVTHRTLASDLDISPLAAESILHTLRPIVTEHYVIPDAGKSVANIQGVGRKSASDET